MSASFTPESLLIAFFQAMADWEATSAADDAASSAEIPLIANRSRRVTLLNAVYQQFCTNRSRVNGRDGSYSIPPEYDPATQTLTAREPVTPKQLWLHTRQTQFAGEELRYLLLFQHGVWRIDRREFFSDASQNWQPCEL